MATENKNEIATTAQETANAPVVMAANEFIAGLQSALSLSPLAHGQQFTTEDLVNADHIILKDFDFAEYHKDGQDVRFAIWRCVLVDNHGEAHEGYHQSGAVLTKLADKIVDCNYINEMTAYGVTIKAKWGKTSTKNNILLVDIIGTAN